MEQSQRDDEFDVSPMQFREAGSESYRAALESIKSRYASTLCRLRSMRADEVAVVASPWDDMVSLLEVIEISYDTQIQPKLLSSEVKILVAGCPLRDSVLSPFDILQVLSNGGVVISSDKAAAWMPVLSDLLKTEKPRGPARSRVIYNQERSEIAPDGALLPVAWLDAGHIPLSVSNARRNGIHLLGTNALNGEPLTIVAELGSGCFLHAVPHWWQPALGQPETELESRTITNVPGFRDNIPSDTRLTVGEYVSAKAMLTLFLSGLEYAFSRLGPTLGSQHSDPLEIRSED